MSKLLITGATGYIGGKLAEYYSQKWGEVRLLVRHGSSLASDLKGTCEVVYGDVTRPETLKDAVNGVDAVIHSAGLLGRWGLPYKQIWDVNVKGAENMIRASFQAGVQRFIHLSAGGVTGPLGPEPVDETYQPHPHTDYERSKWEGEQKALEIAEKENLNLMVVRPTFTFGPADPHKLPLFKAVRSGSFVFIGDGMSTVHPVYIDDLIEGIDLALNSDVRGESLIIGGMHPVSKRDLIWGIANALNVKKPKMKIPIVFGKMLASICEFAAKTLNFNPPITQSRVLMLSRDWGYSIARAKKVLNYNPQVDFNVGLQRTVAWYKEHGWL